MREVQGRVSTTVEIQCESCGVHLSVDTADRTASCPYCDSPYVVERPAAQDRPEPAFVVPFILDHNRAVERVQRWVRTAGMLAHGGVKRASVEKTRGVYAPAYLYGAVAYTDYTARIGERYTTTTGVGKHRRTVVKTEWTPLTGSHAAYVLDVIVTASRGLPNEELQRVEPFDLRALRRYSPELVAGWPTEEPSLAADACLQLAHDEGMSGVGGQLGSFMPGDSYDNLRFDTALREEVLDLVLLPVWVFALRYDEEKPPIRVLVNGQSGRIHGRIPRSGWKIAIVVLAVLALVMSFFLAIAAVNA
jgi:DNA-directed RNA polymerase subunit RPC12/RpoP